MERFQFTQLTGHDVVLLFQGLGITLLVFAASMLIGIVIGFAFALIRRGRVPVAWVAVVCYVELFRNSPLLVQLMLVYFGLPMVAGFHLAPLTAAILTMAVNTSAFMCVIIVAALDAVPRGQWEAARSFGFGYAGMLLWIVLPQAVRTMVPPTITLAVGQLQVSSLVSIISVIDLTKVGGILNIRTLQPFLIWPIIAAFYFAVSKPLSLLADYAERRLRLRSAWTAG